MKYVTASLNKDLDELLDILCRHLQLTETQEHKARTSYGAVGDWLDAQDSPIHLLRPDIFAQGSLALGLK